MTRVKFQDTSDMPKISRRTAELGTENAFVVLAEVNDLVRTGKDIISFCIGQPDFHTPANVQVAAVRAVREGKHGYTPSAGIVDIWLGAGGRPTQTRVFLASLGFTYKRVRAIPIPPKKLWPNTSPRSVSSSTPS